MKKMRKIFALLVAMVMVLGMSMSAMAGSITITRDDSYDGSNGRTYTAYKVFDAVYDSLSGTNTQDDKEPTYTPADAPVAYTMAKDSPWLTAMQATGQTWFDVKLSADESVYVVTPKDGLTESAAPAIADYLNSNKPSGLTGTTITPGTATTVDDGYYLIVASDGATNLTLVTTDVTIIEKNTYITTKKETEETSYSVGDIITYTATVDVPSDASLTDPIILHDEMASVLAFDNTSVEAKMEGNDFTGYTLIESVEDDCTFELSIPVTQAMLGKSIVFTYKAELTSAAINPDTGFINKLFGEKNGYITTPSTPQVWTFDFDFKKTFVGSTDEDLVATFELRTDADDKTTAIAFIAGSAAGSYIVADSDDSGSTTITSTNNAAINVQGLEAGTYYLVELTTSTGYNLLDGPVAVVITDTTDKTATPVVPSHTVTVDGKASTETSPAVIENQSGTVLPSTGGIGTTIFYVVGALLIVGAGVVLVSRRRMNVQ